MNSILMNSTLMYIESVKRALSLMVVMALGLVPLSVLADSGGHVRSVEDVAGEIMVDQSVSGLSDIDCDDVSDAQFEELGDAVMQAMVGDDEQHEVMDNMMGGEGSQSLENIHIAMGQRYLGCAEGQFGTMGMMGGMMSMMGSGFPLNSRYMAGNAYGLSGFSTLLFWGVIIVALVLFVVWLVGRNKEGSAFDILKRRYAKGEISKEEFEEKKQALE